MAPEFRGPPATGASRPASIGSLWAATGFSASRGEFGLFGNLSAKIEYDYLGFGSRHVTLNGSATASCVGPCGGVLRADPTFPFSRTFSVNENIQVIKLGLNYRFGWWGKAPVVASY